MKLLEASVKAATDTKAKESPEPVSVADAKKERAARPAAKKAPKPATGAAESEESEEPEEAGARPARRRKSA